MNLLLAYATKEQIASSLYRNRQGLRLRLFNTREDLATQPALFQEDVYTIQDPDLGTTTYRASRKQFKQYLLGQYLSTSRVVMDLRPDLAANPRYRKKVPSGNHVTDMVIPDDDILLDIIKDTNDLQRL